MAERRLLAMARACEYLGMSRTTLLEAEERGLITPERTLGGHRRYSVEALRELLQATQARQEERAAASQAQGAPELPRFIARLQARAQSPEVALREALRNLVLLLQMEIGAVYLCDDAGALQLRASYGIPHWFLAEMAAPARGSIGEEVIRRGAPLVYDGQAAHRMPAQLEVSQGICAPLTYQDEPLGCVHVISRRRHEFFPGEVNIVATVAVSLASLVINGQLLAEAQARGRQAELLGHLAALAAACPQPEPLLAALLDGALALLDERNGAILLPGRAGRLEPALARGELAWAAGVAPDDGLAGRALASGQPLVCPRLADEALLSPQGRLAAAPGASGLVLPLRAGGAPVGLLCVGADGPRPRCDNTLRALMIACGLVAPAVQRALAERALAV